MPDIDAPEAPSAVYPPVAAEASAAAAEPTAAAAVTADPPSGKKSRRSLAYWTRWLHVYTSMISLVLVLFFGATGLTLNHPSWSFGAAPSAQTSTGTLPAGFAADGTVDFLAVTEFVRAENGASGAVVDYRADAVEGTIAFKGPGYAADLRFDVTSGSYELVSERQGLIAVMNDLHKGRDTTTSWSWVIDISAGLLVLVAATGLGVQLFMRKRRTRAIIVAVLASLLTTVFILSTLA